MFDVKACQRKLAEHYQKTAKVPTTAWSSVSQVDLEQIYTRLSWVRQEQTTAGLSQKKKEDQTATGSSPRELSHYTEMFTEKTKSGVEAKRILVQGETGIGKTTFVKKLLVDWSNLQETKMDEEREGILRRFDLVLAVNLKEVSKCQTLNEMLRRSGLFPADDQKSVDDLLCYIRKNQDRVLLVFDGYDEYRTGSEAEKRYGSRDNSEIHRIFHGNILRDCAVLVTTRPSRGDEIRGPADIQAKITGFNEPDRKLFMKKMLDSETEVDGLLRFHGKSKLNDLARVPLLSLFFCLLWNEEKGKLKELTERKAKLYQAIVKHILQHSHRRRQSSSKASKLKETDYEEILAEIGKVALAGLLKGDLLFEFGQLPEKVRGEEGVIVGLFQFSEYGPSLEPMEMVSFIHKSIQEYLAAWYLIYSCVPKGNLGEIEQHAATLENCEALENVFQFVCDLSDEGAMKILDHLKSVRISDPTLDLSKSIPDEETETDVRLCNVIDRFSDLVYRQKRFSNLVYDSFREVPSKAELLSHFLDCNGGVILVIRERHFSELIPNVDVLIKLARNCVFLFDDLLHLSEIGRRVEASLLYKSLDFLNCLQTPLRVTDTSDVLTEDFPRKFELKMCRSYDCPPLFEDLLRQLIVKNNCLCAFRPIVCLRNGQFQFFITCLSLTCDDHVRLFTKSNTTSVPSNAASLWSDQLCLKFLSILNCDNLSSQTVKALGAVIGNCKHLSRIDVNGDDDSVCCLLEQVRNPSKCFLSIHNRLFRFSDCATHLTSVAPVQLASLLPRFNTVITLELDLRDCGAAALDTLVPSITHKTLERLELRAIILTPAVTKALGQSLPEMSSLQVLELTGVNGSILPAEEMETLFSGCNKTMPLLKQLTFSGFNVRGGLAALMKSLPFFPNLEELKLEKLNIDEHDQCSLLKSFGPFLMKRKVCIHVFMDARDLDSFRYYTSMLVKTLDLGVISLTPTSAAKLGRLLPEMSSLQALELTGVDGSILQAEEMEALFGGFNKTMPLLEQLTFSGFNVRGCLAPLIKSLPFFPNLRELRLERLNIDEHDQCSLLKSFGSFLMTHQVRIHEGTDLDSFRYDTRRDVKTLDLGVISLTPTLAAMLGRLLPEMSSLQELELFGVDGSILQAEEMEALFGGFNKTMPLLKQLTFSGFNVRGCLAPLIKSLPFFPNLKLLKLEKLNTDEHDQCSLLKSFGSFLMKLEVHIHEETDLDSFRFYTSMFVKTVELGVINLTPTFTAMLGRLLPEMSSLLELELTGVDGSILQAEEMEALFGGFNKTMPSVHELIFASFNVRGRLSPLFRSLRFFPNLLTLELSELNIDEHDLRGLLESSQFVPNLQMLSLSNNPLGHAVTSIVPHVINLKKLRYLLIDNTCHSEEDLNYVRDTVQQALPYLKFSRTRHIFNFLSRLTV